MLLCRASMETYNWLINVSRQRGTIWIGHAYWPITGTVVQMFNLEQCAEKKWRRLHGFDCVAKVVTGVKFKDGIEVTEIDQVAA